MDSSERKKQVYMNKPVLKKVQFITYTIAMILVISLLGYMACYVNTEIWKPAENQGILQIENVEKSTVANSDAPIGTEEQFRFTLGSSMEEDLTLVFYSCHNNVRVYLDGEYVYNVKIVVQIKRTTQVKRILSVKKRALIKIPLLNMLFLIYF